ncbi:MAG: alpha/beta fold hydrolase, partial [Anaerolineales bacterium]|nr:alpha/beta fold hydrolase [Anaerolineales bacterium]
YDHRGSGATLAPVESITYEALVDDVFAVLDYYGVQQCTLAAMSMGAAVAFGAALRQPERFSRLIIVNGAYVWNVPEAQDDFLHGLRHAYAPTLEQFIQWCVPEPESEPIKHWGRQILSRAKPEAALALYQITRTLDLRAQLPAITQPTLILHGDADPILPLASSQWLAQNLPNAQLKIINGAGHVPIMTRPAEVAQLIQNFLDS